MRRLTAITIALATMLAAAPTSIGEEPTVSEETGRAVVRGYARHVQASYALNARLAGDLLETLRAFAAKPDHQTLGAARDAWIAGRVEYGKTEAFRFYGGPVDHPRTGIETFMNAWPLDEAYIDAVDGAPDAGIINNPERYPQISPTLLTFVNERNGEANVSIGWHAIEFLLWGQDTDADGPGRRSPADFADGAPNVERRRTYLITVGELLVRHLTQLRDDWADKPGRYGATFLRDDPKRSIEKMLAGVTVLSGFEMSAERLAVAYETRDQEQEHSCFSDTTHLDMIANQRGVMAVYFGDRTIREPDGLRRIALEVDPPTAAALDEQLQAALDAIMAIPVPFDQTILAPDGSDARKAMLSAIEALEAQAESFAFLGQILDLNIPIAPPG